MNRRQRSRTQSTPPWRTGFSIPELLTVCGIIGLLAALTFPAIQSSRERARATSCRNNLRQLGLACHEHDAVRGTFPLTSMRPGPIGSGLPRAISPHTQLLPYIAPDVAPHYDANDETLTYARSNTPPTSVNRKNRLLLRRQIPTFVCPSDQGPPGTNSYRANMGISPKQYAGIVRRDPMAERGAFVNDRAIRPDEFFDGQSNTALFSEKLIGDGSPASYTPWRDRHIIPTAMIYNRDDAIRICRDQATANPAEHASFSGYTWLYGGWSQTWYLHLVPPNSSIPDCSNDISFRNGQGLYPASSLHVGGANCVLADGSVRLIASQIDAQVWLDMGTRNGNGH